jgi:hypothetical protein
MGRIARGALFVDPTSGFLKYAYSRWPYCQWCGCKLIKPVKKGHKQLSNTATRDHIVPLARGGSNNWSNLVISCRNCNGYKDNLMPDREPIGPKWDNFEIGTLEMRRPEDDSVLWSFCHSGWIALYRGDESSCQKKLDYFNSKKSKDMIYIILPDGKLPV